MGKSEEFGQFKDVMDQHFPKTIKVVGKEIDFVLAVVESEFFLDGRKGRLSIAMQGDRRVIIGDSNEAPQIKLTAGIRDAMLTFKPIAFTRDVSCQMRSVSRGAGDEFNRLLDELTTVGDKKISVRADGLTDDPRVKKLIELLGSGDLSTAEKRAVVGVQVARLELAVNKALLKELIGLAPKIGIETIRLVIERVSCEAWLAELAPMGFSEEGSSGARQRVSFPPGMDYVILERPIKKQEE